MANVGEKAAFDSIQLKEFSVAFLQHLSTFVQLETDLEFPKEQSIIEIISGNNDNAGQNKKIKIVEEIPRIKVCCVCVGRAEIHQYNTGDGNHRVTKTPMSHSANGEQY